MSRGCKCREARESLREGALSHLREDVREAMARHPVSEAQAKDAINDIVNLDSVLRKAERGDRKAVVFPALLDAVDSLTKITNELQQEGSLYSEEFTSPAPLKKRWLPK